ncbi:MAG TPA: PspC domain-containing protein [Vicinamibacterales bacterium]|nr:PspC domain-containing protein [Vicinamibacterales bacterium]
MQKVITINLNGNAFQLDESGFNALRAYLDDAADQLEGNPDAAEIIADLEQAVADKCARHLGAHKTVVSAAEVEKIIVEMGPVEGGPEKNQRAGAGGGAAQEQPKGKTRSEERAPRRLYQIREGAMLSGVCTGLAAYLNVDVTIIRVAFVVLALLTKGLWVLVYLALSFVIPYAETSEEQAAARGLPFRAQEVIDRAKQKAAKFKDDGDWRQRWRRQQQQWSQQWQRAVRQPWPPMGMQPAYAARVWAGVLMPLLALAQVAAFIALAIAIVSLVDTGSVFGWVVPQDVPLWASVLALIILYQIVTAPISAARSATHYAYHKPQEPWFVFTNGVLSLAAAVIFFWLAYTYLPEVRQFVHSLPAMWEAVSHSAR